MGRSRRHDGRRARFDERGSHLALGDRLGGSAVPDRIAFAPADELLIPGRLPRETIAYLALSTKSGLSGAEAERLLISRVGAADPSAAPALLAELEVLREQQGLSIAAAHDALGREAAIAVLAAPAATLSPASGDLLSRSVALAYVQQLSGSDLAARAVASVRERVRASDLGAASDVKTTAAGFSTSPRGDAPAGMPSIRVEVVGDHLIAALGAPALVERVFAAQMRGEATLASDEAHGRAIASLPKAGHARAWLDTARITAALGAKAPEAQASAAGPTRSTTALSAELGLEGGWTYRVDVHDAFALVPVLRALSEGFGAAQPPVALVQPGAPVGVAECDDYLARLAACISDLPPHQRVAMLEESNRARDAWRAAAVTSRTSVASMCKTATSVLHDYCG
jgi:hypothetical protein